MYTAEFIADNGTSFKFDLTNNLVFDIDGLSGLNVDLKTAQGARRIGESLQASSIKGTNLTIRGQIYQDITKVKSKMQKAFPPFGSGRLIFENKYYIYTYVKNTPKFSPSNNRGDFDLRLFAPFPLFRKLKENIFYIGQVIPMFSFPVTYSPTHQYGLKNPSKYINVFNDGDIKAAFTVNFSTNSTSSNITLTNLSTFAFLKLNGTITADEKIKIYYDTNNQLRCELIKKGKVTNILSWIDEDSTLFELEIGDNLILASDEADGANLVTTIIFNTAVASVYED